VTIKVVHKNRN